MGTLKCLMQMLGVETVTSALMTQAKLFIGGCLCLLSWNSWAWQQEQLDGMNWREVGPYRGGRSAAVAGIPQDRETYYFGSTGGGVWKTQDAGQHWKNISDGFFGGSIGAVAVSAWDPNVVYVGTGEKTVRGNVSQGKGLWKSTDAGRNWQHMGLVQGKLRGPAPCLSRPHSGTLPIHGHFGWLFQRHFV